jgi:uncharacterized protein (DUF362 family)
MLQELRTACEFTGITTYPETVPYHPTEAYPEYRGDVTSQPLSLYGNVRTLLFRQGLDAKRFGTADWNPFGVFIKPGMTVFIKTNTVTHVHKKGGDVRSVIVHASLVRPVLDYVCLALKGKGRIIIGDSQVYNADFDKAMEASGIRALLDWYREQTDIPIECFDLRLNKARRTLLYGSWARTKIEHDPRGYRFVDLGKESYFEGIDPNKLRIGMESYQKMRKYHGSGKHLYQFPGSLLDSDVIINMPKVKTHRRTGITLAIKNFMGLPSLKESLPHFQVGTPEEGGDQYINKSFRKKIGTWMHDIIQSHPVTLVKFIFAIIKKISWNSSRIIPFKDDVFEAMWPGNDTVWRTLLDLNRAALYADRNGKLQPTQQREYFCLMDGIIAGEGDGPLIPDAVEAGVLLSSFSPGSIDAVASTLMGFDVDKLRLVKRAIDDTDRFAPLFFGTREDIEIIDNGQRVNLETFGKEHNLHFKTHPNWTGSIERDWDGESSKVGGSCESCSSNCT